MALEPEVTRASDPLAYRRQFVLSPQPLAEFATWNSMKIGDHAHLIAHPDLNLLQVQGAGNSLTLLGYILDARHPDSDDRTVLEALLPRLCSEGEPAELLQAVNHLGGRWILIVENGADIWVLNDALAQRQVYYNSPSVPGQVWCASQPRILAEFLGLEPSVRSAQFVEKQKQAGQLEYWFPNDTSPYEAIKLLLPNHYLNLATGKPERFWPRENIGRVSIRKAVKPAASLLRGQMKSAANRFPLEILITAGWDSRTVLAATKDLQGDIRYYTFVDEGTNPADIEVPAKLLPKLGRSHNILRIPGKSETPFKERYLRNVAAAHETWVPVAEALSTFCRPSALRVSGSGSETVRQQLRPHVTDGVTAEILAGFAKARQEFAVDEFGRWLAGVPKNCDIGILDLFYWEQKCGQWLAVGQTEWDLVGESFAPFNCRELLALLLPVAERYRVPPHYKLYRAFIRHLWPAVLSEPVNPHKKNNPLFKGRSKQLIIRDYLKQVLPPKLLAVARRLYSTSRWL